MNKEFFTGELVNLVPVDLEKDMELWERWDYDSEYKRQLDDVPAAMYSAPLAREWQENHLDSGAHFMIRTIDGDKVIGFIDLCAFDWAAGNAWVGIGIGEADYRGKGYGSDAMQLVLDYAFRALNLHRVNLEVFAFNKRAIRSYEKCGFRYEGTLRETIYKEDQRWDMIEMGILQSEWQTLQRLQEPVSSAI